MEERVAKFGFGALVRHRCNKYGMKMIITGGGVIHSHDGSSEVYYFASCQEGGSVQRHVVSEFEIELAE